METLHGYVVTVDKDDESLDISLIASSEDRAISRARLSMFYSTHDASWLEANYVVTETVSLEEFKAGRAAGTR